MTIQQHFQKAGRLLAMGLFLWALVVTPAAAEYLNETVTDPNDPAYWLDLGGLYATYGAHKAAIKAYQKALELAADNSDVYFNMGVAYGEMGEYDQALAAINKAIALDSNNDRYYYGRAWVFLMEGSSADAMGDFEKAAAMGNLDAIAFLNQ